MPVAFLGAEKLAVTVFFARLSLATIFTLAAVDVCAQPASSGDKSHQVQVTGKVVDSQGKPIRGVQVFIEQSLPNQFKHEFEMVVTDETGRYELVFSPIQNARFALIRVHKSGYAIAQHQIEFAGSTAVVEHNFLLQTAQPMRCRLLDADGQPVAGARVVSVESRNASRNRLWLSTQVIDSLGEETPTSDAEGLVDVPWLAANLSYDIGFTHPDFAQALAWSAKHAPEPQSVIMERGQEAEFAFVSSEHPEAVGDAWVELLVSRDEGRFVEKLAVDEQGRGKIRLLSDGYISMTPHHPTLATQGTERYSGRRINTFLLFETAKVRGRVLNIANTQGVEGVNIFATVQRTTAASVSSALDGSFEMDLPASNVTIELSDWSKHWKHEPQKHSVRLRPGEIHELDAFFVQAKLPLRGQVMLDDRPVANAIIFDLSSQYDHCLTNAEGAFELELTGFDRESVVVAMHPYQPFSIALATDNERQDLMICLSAESSLVGRAIDARGKPLPRTKVQLGASFEFDSVHVMSNDLQTTYSRDDGTFRFRGLSAGAKYRALIQGRLSFGDRESNVVGSWLEPRKSMIDRTPLVVGAALQREIESLEVAEPLMPAKLPLQLTNGQLPDWLHSSTLAAHDLQGKIVLLGYGGWPELLTLLDDVHRVYSKRGLAVVSVLPQAMSPKETSVETSTDAFRLKSVSYPVVFDDGLLQEYPAAAVAIYDSHGELLEQFSSSNFRKLWQVIRNTMVFK